MLTEAVAQASGAQASVAQAGGESVGVLEVLLALCHALRIDINRMAVKSDSRTTALHRAPDLGARVRIRVRVRVGVGVGVRVRVRVRGGVRVSS